MTKEITLNTRELELSIKDLLIEHCNIMEKLNSSAACRKEDCINRLELIERRDAFDHILRILDLQTHQYFNEKGYVDIKIN